MTTAQEENGAFSLFTFLQGFLQLDFPLSLEEFRLILQSQQLLFELHP